MKRANTGLAHFVYVEFDSADALYAAYMPFVDNGGLFVCKRQLADTDYSLGDHVDMLMRFHDNCEPLRIPGRVAWLALWSRNQDTAGIGVRLDDGGEAKTRIEGLLEGMLDSDQPTLTL